MSKSIFKKKPYKRIEVGGGVLLADFYVDERNADVEHNYLHIHTPNHVFEQRVVGYPYGYLLTAVNQGKEEEVHNYCVLLWRVSQEIYQDAGLAADIIKAFGKYDKRLMKRAERSAREVSEAQDDADAALMNDIIAEQGLSKRGLAKKRKADRELLRAVLTENEGEKRL